MGRRNTKATRVRLRPTFDVCPGDGVLVGLGHPGHFIGHANEITRGIELDWNSCWMSILPMQEKAGCEGGLKEADTES